MKYTKDLRVEFSKKTAFTIRDIKNFLSKKNISSNYLGVLLHNLRKKGELKRIGRGVYTLREELEVVGFAFFPFYYGLQESLSIRNLWEQETNPVVLTTRKIRAGMRNFLGNNYVVKRINRKMFFGFEMVRYYDFWIPVSDVEKTLIDFVYFREPLLPDTLAEIKKRINMDVLRNYLKRCPERVRKKVVALIKQTNKKSK